MISRARPLQPAPRPAVVSHAAPEADGVQAAFASGTSRYRYSGDDPAPSHKPAAVSRPPAATRSAAQEIPQQQLKRRADAIALPVPSYGAATPRVAPKFPEVTSAGRAQQARAFSSLTSRNTSGAKSQVASSHTSSMPRPGGAPPPVLRAAAGATQLDRAHAVSRTSMAAPSGARAPNAFVGTAKRAPVPQARAAVIHLDEDTNARGSFGTKRARM